MFFLKENFVLLAQNKMILKVGCLYKTKEPFAVKIKSKDKNSFGLYILCHVTKYVTTLDCLLYLGEIDYKKNDIQIYDFFRYHKFFLHNEIIYFTCYKFDNMDLFKKVK